MRFNASLRAAVPILVFAAIVASSVLVFLRAPHELWRAHALALAGAVVIYFSWFRYRHKVSVARVLPAFLLILFVFYRGQAFHQLAMGGYTYDLYLLYADRGFGFHPSLATYALVDRLGLFSVISVVYESLCLCIGLCYATQMGPGKKPWRVIAVLALPAILGPLCYRLLPACGPVWLLGSSCYTGDLPSTCANISFSGLAQVQLDGAWPRNAMPSMHLAWALLIWWALRDMKVGRWIGLAYAFATALATLGGGEHYLVDLVAAFPFSLAVWSLCMGEAPPVSPRRMLPLAGSCAALLVWIVCIRTAPQLFWISPVLTWGAALSIVAGTVYAQFRFWPVSKVRDATA